MFKLNKRSSIVILVIGIVVVVLVVLSVGGVILWKYLQKPEKESKSRDRDKVEDCGVSESFLSDFSSPIDVDFEKDEAMLCMGENMQNRCKESEAVVKIEGAEFIYEISGTRESNCKIKIEHYDIEREITSSIECPVLELASFFKEEEPELGERLSGPPQDYAAFLFLMVVILANDIEAASDIGCTLDVPEDYNVYNNRIKSDLAQLRTMAEMHYFDNDDSYTGFTASDDFVLPECSGDVYVVQVSPDGQKFLAYASLCGEDTFWCADSTGFFGEVAVGSIPNNIYTCP